MPGIVIIKELVIVLAVAAAAVYILRNVRLPSIVGLLVAGVLVGPGVLGLVSDRETVEVLAEVGVIFLLFTIGLRFSINELLRLRQLVFGAGALQLVGTTIVAGALAWLAGAEPRQSIFLGMLVGMSSTAIVLRLLEERGEIIAPHGRLMVSILIFQDIAVVPMMLFLPLLADTGDASWVSALQTAFISVGLLVVILTAAHFGLPHLLDRVVRARSRELFTLATVVVALGTAWLCSLAGASLPLGAFLAGVVLSESRYAQQILSDVLPLRTVFASLFFVSVGMLVSPDVWGETPLELTGLLLLVVVGKALIVAVIAVMFGFGGRVAVLAGLGLAQIGEFSFIIASAGSGLGLFKPHQEQLFFTVAVLSMALTPLLGLVAQGLVTRGERIAWLRRYVGKGRASKDKDAHEAETALEDHVIIIGFGINGRNVARVLRLLEVPYHILELNPHTVRMVRAEGDRIHYGDATREDVLLSAGADRARALVVAIADPSATRQIVAVARGVNPVLQILVRTRFIGEVEQLRRLGADTVVPEEFETSLELAGQVMATYGAGPGAIHREKAAMRQEQYTPLRDAAEPKAVPTLAQLLAHAELDYVTIPEGSSAAGRTLHDLDLRRRSGATVLSVKRGGRATPNPPGDAALGAGDELALFGAADQIEAARAILEDDDAE